MSRIKEIFAEALELRGSNRTTYLDSACGEDRAMRDEVESLLNAAECSNALLGNAPDSSVPLFERPGSVIGRYKLLEAIGEGGFGVVFRAEQQSPVRRIVALKIIKLGMDTRQVVARFEAERQALAMMDHSSIAKVFDAGATQTGRPYFVMELVQGTPLTEYCDKQHLSTGQRLELFVAVCHAVQHAHQKGIIHRDLKPSNVLVTLQDGTAVPKVIDFGVSKAVEGKLTEKTLFTELRQMVGTPTYMSPEQALFGGLDLDTRSDIYSLGVLLYELLTGTTPFDSRQLLCAAYEEMQRILREVEPPMPSTRLTTMAVETQSSVAEERKSDPRRLNQTIRGELDWIVMRCLEKDRTRRYESVSILALDVQRYLSGEPIQASPPSARYRVGKFVKRHRIALATASAFVLLLLAALIVSASLAVRARHAEQSALHERDNAESARKEAVAQRQEAIAQRQQAEEIAGYLTAALSSPVPWQDGRSVTIAEVLERDERELQGRFDDNPATKAALQLAIGGAYSGLGLYREAVRLLEKSVELRKAALGLEHPDTLTSMQTLAWAYDRAGRGAEALRLGLAVLELRTKRLGPNHPDTIHTKYEVGLFYLNLDQIPQAIAILEELLKQSTAVNGPDDRVTLQIMASLGPAYRSDGQLDKSILLQAKSAELVVAKFGREDPETFFPRSILADRYRESNRTREAVKLAEEIVALITAKLGPDHPDTLAIAHGLALDYRADGRLDDAIKLMEQTLKLMRARMGSDHAMTIWLIGDLADAYLADGRKEAAFALGEEILAIPIQKLTSQSFGPLSGVAYMFQRGGRLEDSLLLNQRVMDLRKATFGLANKDTLMSMAAVVNNYQELGRLDDAIRLLEQTLAIQSTLPSMANIESFNNTSNLVATLAGLKAKRQQPNPQAR